MVRVVRAVSTDSILVAFEDGATTTVSLLGIDAPGSEPSPNDSILAGCLAHWGMRAAEHITRALEGHEVIIVLDERGTPSGSSGGLPVYVQMEGGDFGASLVKQGLATVDTRIKVSLLAAYLQLEEQARSQTLGLWLCGPSTARAKGAPPPGPEFAATWQRASLLCTRHQGEFIFRTTADIVSRDAVDPAGLASGGHCVLHPK